MTRPPDARTGGLRGGRVPSANTSTKHPSNHKRSKPVTTEQRMTNTLPLLSQEAKIDCRQRDFQFFPPCLRPEHRPTSVRR